MKEDQIAKDRVEAKVRQKVKDRQADHRIQSIFQELQHIYQASQDSIHSDSHANVSPVKDPTQHLEDIEMMRICQNKLADCQKHNDLLRIQLAEAQKTTDVMREMLEKERVRTRTLQQNFTLRQKQQLGDQKSQFEGRIRQNLKIIDELQGQRRELTVMLDSARQELISQRDQFRKQMQHVKQQHGRELKASRDSWATMQRERREKWQKKKQAEIKQRTIKGMEPQIQKIIKTSRQQVKDTEEKCQRKILDIREELALDFQVRARKLKDQAFLECQNLLEQERKDALIRQKEQFQKMGHASQSQKAELRSHYDQQLRQLELQRKKESQEYIQKINKAYEQNLAQQKRLRKEFQGQIRQLTQEKEDIAEVERGKAETEKCKIVTAVKDDMLEEYKGKLQKAMIKMASQRDDKITVIVERMAQEKLQFEENMRLTYEEKYRMERKARQDAQKRTEKEVLLLELKLKQHKDQLGQERAKREWAQSKTKTVLQQLDNKVESQISKARDGLEERILQVKVKAGKEAQIKYLGQIGDLQKEVANLKEAVRAAKVVEKQGLEEKDLEMSRMEHKWCEQVDELEKGFKKVLKKKDEELKKLASQLKNAQQAVHTYENLLEKQRANFLNNL